MQTSKRAICDRCKFPLNTCICEVLSVTNAPIDIVILQDKWEAKHAKNTGRLVAACLRNTTVINCDAETDLLSKLEQCIKASPNATALVYPLSKPDLLDGNNRDVMTHIKRLIFIDTTWRKSTRLLNRYPWLQDLHCILIDDIKPSKYVIRKSRKLGGISTLEAVCEVLKSGYDYEAHAMYACLNKMQAHWNAHADSDQKSLR